MNINLRALVFGAAVATALTASLTAAVDVAAAERVQVIQLDRVEVTGHRAVDADADVIRLDPVMVTGHRDAV